MPDDDLANSSPLARPGETVWNQNTLHGPESFKIEYYLGKGGFAQCFSAYSSLRRENVALKIVDKVKTKDPNNRKLHREISIHSVAQHPNIARLYDSFETPHLYYLVMELCQRSNLLSTINRCHTLTGYMDESECRHYLRGTLSAANYLLGCRILHRDIKPGNIFIGLNGEVKLGDFGLAVHLEDVNPNSVSGTPNYLSPEVLSKCGHSERSEVWSIGCLLFCMLTGRPPFESDSIEKTYKRISEASYSFSDRVRAIVSMQAIEIVNWCLELNQHIRPTFIQLLKSDWIASEYLSHGRSGANSSGTYGATISRARSVGSIACSDVNGNNISSSVSGRTGRPKSVTSRLEMISIADRTDRSRKSMTASHDSGFGSEVDMSQRPILAERVNRILADLRHFASGTYTLTPSTMPEAFVSKWVDYTNRRGFACRLTDGSLTVKYLEGACLSWQDESMNIVYVTSPFSSPRLMNIHHKLSESEKEQIDVARQYRQYMDTELAGVDYHSSPSHTHYAYDSSPYLVFNKLGPAHLIMVLSNGTVQVNALWGEKTKVVLWYDYAQSRTGVVIIERGEHPKSYRIVPRRYRGPELNNHALKRIADQLFNVENVISSECDFLYCLRKPLQCTEL